MGTSGMVAVRSGDKVFYAGTSRDGYPEYIGLMAYARKTEQDALDFVQNDTFLNDRPNDNGGPPWETSLQYYLDGHARNCRAQYDYFFDGAWKMSCGREGFTEHFTHRNWDANNKPITYQAGPIVTQLSRKHGTAEWVPFEDYWKAYHELQALKKHYRDLEPTRIKYIQAAVEAANRAFAHDHPVPRTAIPPMTPVRESRGMAALVRSRLLSRGR